MPFEPLHLHLSLPCQIPRAEARAQEQRLLASYLTCTGIVPTSAPAPANESLASPSSASPSPSPACLERLSCELHQTGGDASGASALERHVMRV